MRDRWMGVEKGVEMKNFVYGWILAAAAATLTAAPTPAFAQEGAPKVATILTVDVAAVDQDAFLQRISQGQAIWKKLGIPPFRVWQSTLSGPTTGTIVFVTEYDGAGAWVQNSGKLQASPEWEKWIDDLQAWGKSSVSSNSMMVEITP